eukprot:gene19664-19384_t
MLTRYDVWWFTDLDLLRLAGRHMWVAAWCEAGLQPLRYRPTVRALYAEYSGPLYKVSRTDGSGFANISAQEEFCAAGDCLITKVYDQSPEGNHLGQRISCVPGYGYNVDITTGVAKGNDPESIYAAIYFGNAAWNKNKGLGSGPWAGMYYGGGAQTIVNNQSTPLTSDFQGAIILGTGGDNSNGAEGNFYEGYIATGLVAHDARQLGPRFAALRWPGGQPGAQWEWGLQDHWFAGRPEV